MANRDDLFVAMLANAEKHFGKSSVYVAAEQEQHIVGIPIPNFALPLQYVVQNNIWPLHRISLLAGPFGSCKSTLAFELARWFIYSGSVVGYIETENKLDSGHIERVLGNCVNRLKISTAGSMEEWQTHLTTDLEFVGEAQKEIVCPYLGIIDSMTGVDTAEGIEQFKKTGHARGRSFSDMSIGIAQYLRNMSAMIKDIPAHVLMINHQKRDLKTLPGGRMVEGKRKPGGDSQNFHATLDISVSKIGTIDLASRRGLKIGMKCEKNSMGETHLNGYFEVIFSDKQLDNGQVAHSTWIDWYTSIPMFLVGFVKASRQKRIKDIIEITEASNKWSCKQLGLSRVTPGELGRAIVADEKIFTSLQDALGITRRPNTMTGPSPTPVPDPGPGFAENTGNISITDDDEDPPAIASLGDE